MYYARKSNKCCSLSFHLLTITQVDAGIVGDNHINKSSLHMRVVNENFIWETLKQNKRLNEDDFVINAKESES